MGLWRFLLMFALAFGAVLPHCAAAAPEPAPVVHHAGMAQGKPQPGHHSSHIPTADACVGCAAPVRFVLTVPAEPMATSVRYTVHHQKLATRFTALDPPPPRTNA